MPANNGESLEYFSTAFLQMGNSDFQKVTDWNKTIANQGKTTKSQRGGVIGVSRGKPEVQITFNAVQGEDGPEHDWEKLVEDATIKTIRRKSPGGRVDSYRGIFTNHVENSPLEGEVTDALTFVGKRIRSK